MTQAKIHICPVEDCTTNGRRTRLQALGDRDPEATTWRTYIDPQDGAKILRCPTHGRFILHADSDTPVKVQETQQ